jgi:hypothetical protein
MGTPKTPETEGTTPFSVDIDTTLRILEHAAALTQKEATRQAALEIIGMPDQADSEEPRTLDREEPRTLDREELGRMAETLSITPAALDLALKLNIIPPEEQKTDAAEFSDRTTVKALLAEKIHTADRLEEKLTREILATLTENYPSHNWNTEKKVDYDDDIDSPGTRYAIKISFGTSQTIQRKRGKILAFLTGKTWVDENTTTPFAQITITVSTDLYREIHYRKKAYLFTPVAMKRLGNILKKNEFEVTRTYPILDD